MKNNFKSFNLKTFLSLNNIDESSHSRNGLTGLLKILLIGKQAEANHPKTCFNPEETFSIFDLKLEGDGESLRLFVRGENTCWFGSNVWKLN